MRYGERVFVLADPIIGNKNLIRFIRPIHNAVNKRAGTFYRMIAAGVVNVNDILNLTDRKA